MTRGRAAGATALVVVAAVVMIVLGDSRAWSGSDAGGRAATVVAMHDRGSWTPEVGYWAERWDPSGDLHPLVNTERRGGHWVQATSVPFALVERALFDLGGFPGLLVVPLAGLLLAASAAGRLATWVGASTSRPAFLAVGLASPALFYAGDAWEHAPALGAGLASLAMALAGRSWRSALVAGVVGGGAVVLRAEMAVYLAAAALIAVVMPGQRHRWLRERGRAVAVVVGALAVVLANAALERAVLGGGLRDARAESLVRGAGSSLGGRASDAALTSVGVVATSSASAFAIGALVAAALVVLAWWALWGRPARAVLAGGAIAAGLALGVAARVDDGLGFVPGWLPAAPLAAAGLAALRPMPWGGGLHAGDRPDGQGDRLRFLAAVALVGLPGVWLTSHVGLLEAQWGGRYTLASGALLTVVGVVALQRVHSITWASVALVTVAVAVAGSGVAWHVVRTNEIAATGAWVARETPPDAVVVSRWPHLGRELGAWYDGDRWPTSSDAGHMSDAGIQPGGARWLTAEDSEEADRALEVAADAGASSVVVLLLPGQSVPTTAGWDVEGQRTRTVFGARLTAVRLWRDPGTP